MRVSLMVFVSSFLMLLGLVSAVPAGAAPKVDPGCSDVLFVGARGSGQPQAGSSSDGSTGVGAQVYSAYSTFKASVSQASVELVPVVYPALGVELLTRDPRSYFGGLEQGVTATKGVLSSRLAACPATRVVLAGFSQGAMVMERVVKDLSKSSSKKQLTRVDGVLLLANGDRMRGDNVRASGSARTGWGISRSSDLTLLGVSSGARSWKFPRVLRSRVYSVCEAGDIVCAYSSGDLLSGGTGVHTSGYNASPVVAAAARSVARRVKAHL